ncbi:MAG: hypothetical protein JWN52_4461 [Actinomycetia bacterium]|nr:hypothetical protein [Actinomycetes bacterium]
MAYGCRHDEENRVVPEPVSVVYERSALDRPVSLFDHAERLHQRAPDSPLPDGGKPFPDEADHGSQARDEASYQDRKAALAAALETFFAIPGGRPEDLHAALIRPEISARTVCIGAQHDLPFTPEPERAREIGLWLARYGYDRRPVMVGLALLRETAQRQDISLVKTIGLLKCFDSAAVKVLASIPDAAPELIWLAERSRPYPRSSAVGELCRLADPATLPWLLRHAMDDRRGVSSTLARQIAEVTSLADALAEDPCDEQVWDQAGRLLLAMTSTRNYETEVGRYEKARLAYRRFAASAVRMTPTLDRCAALISITEDLQTGPAACLPWADTERESVISELLAVLRSPAWSQTLNLGVGSTDPTTRWRARWAKEAAQRGAGDDTANAKAGNRFEIRVVMPDPDPEDFPQVETRILIGGRPIIAAAFNKGPAGMPERLLRENGGLRADVEPHEVRLAEAYCTEGCCGGLYVTIVREGDQVVWRDWRSSTKGDPPGEFRFDADQYDQEVARAERDHSWEWPARSLARHLDEKLRATPEVLGQWGCWIDWVTAWIRDGSQTRLLMSYPQPPSHGDGKPWLLFGLLIDADDRDPAVQATELLGTFRTTDPKTMAEVVGGSRDYADQLGFPWPEKTRW